MLCHHAAQPPETEQGTHPCHGRIKAVGYDAIGVRLLVMRGTVNHEDVTGHTGPELYDSFDDMLDANGIEPPRRNRYDRPPPANMLTAQPLTDEFDTNLR